MKHKTSRIKASLTLEAALVLPLFIYFFIALLYFIRIFTVQEYIQEALTKKGLSIAKTAYIYSDFLDIEEAESFDGSLFQEELDVAVDGIADAVFNPAAVKLLLAGELDTDIINHSCIKDGFQGISFYYSEILGDSDCIDLVARFHTELPIPFFGLSEMWMIQRVRLRAWTGHKVPAAYTMSENGDDDEAFVYITETGTVYHRNENCSHIKLTVKEAAGIPSYLRNESGGKYYPCESCCGHGASEQPSGTETYYITSFGDRYHASRSCPGIKRTVKKVPMSEVSGMNPCKRCGYCE